MQSNNIIKVIGIGGGGVNMVDSMYNMGIHGVDFAVCHTDYQSFEGVNVPVKVHFGESVFVRDIETARSAFEENVDKFTELLTDNIRMVFIVAGMGGSTGSGVAPLLAEMAKSKGILTVGIVTEPFLFERWPRIIQAAEAVEEMSKHVDALIVVKNELLKTLFPDSFMDECFNKANGIVAMTVKSISEIITQKGIINRDFYDINYMMKDSGLALVSYGFGKGENRIDNAIREALDSPLLKNNNIYDAKKLLFYLSLKPESQIKVEEVQQSLNKFMDHFDICTQVIWGFEDCTSLTEGQEVKFTIIATGTN